VGGGAQYGEARARFSGDNSSLAFDPLFGIGVAGAVQYRQWDSRLFGGAVALRELSGLLQTSLLNPFSGLYDVDFSLQSGSGHVAVLGTELSREIPLGAGGLKISALYAFVPARLRAVYRERTTSIIPPSFVIGPKQPASASEQWQILRLGVGLQRPFGDAYELSWSVRQWATVEALRNAAREAFVKAPKERRPLRYGGLEITLALRVIPNQS
jgi:hypothetical protein